MNFTTTRSTRVRPGRVAMPRGWIAGPRRSGAGTAGSPSVAWAAGGPGGRSTPQVRARRTNETLRTERRRGERILRCIEFPRSESIGCRDPWAGGGGRTKGTQHRKLYRMRGRMSRAGSEVESTLSPTFVSVVASSILIFLAAAALDSGERLGRCRKSGWVRTGPTRRARCCSSRATGIRGRSREGPKRKGPDTADSVELLAGIAGGRSEPGRWILEPESFSTPGRSSSLRPSSTRPGRRRTGSARRRLPRP